MPTLPSRCPSCDSTLLVTRLRCDHCDTQLEGAFELHPLLQLPVADLEFVVRFVKASGSLKDVASHYGQSYPTVRNRLNDILTRLGRIDDQGSAASRRKSILDAIADGTLTAAQAEKKLREVT